MEKEPEEKMVETQQPETENSEAELNSEEVSNPEPQSESVPGGESVPRGESEPQSESAPGGESEPVVEEERKFTQAEVDKLVGKIRNEARERGKKEALDELLNKYGYDDVSQLDDTVGESERYAGRADEYESLKNENLLLRAGVNEDRFEDVLAYFTYKNMPINPITLEEAIEAHPEWTGFSEYDTSDDEEEEAEEKPSVVRRLGAEPIRKNDNPSESEEERAMRIMGL